MNDDIKVSISCLTFNHEKYLIDCFEGFLKQKCNFKFEVLIHDDCSTDRTIEIIESYQKKYPQIFKSYIQKENQFSLGIRGLQYKYNFTRAKGKYIAICEGDDYWTDEFKLQKQYDFLERNSEYFTHCHNSQVIGLESRVFSNELNRDYMTKDVLGFRKFHTNSLFFRNEPNIFKNLIHFKPVLSGDKQFYIFLSTLGKIKYVDEIMSIYRKNDFGLSLNVDYNKLKYDFNIIDNLHDILTKDQIVILINNVFYTSRKYTVIKMTILEKLNLAYRYLFYKYQYSKINFADIKQIINYLRP